jgi:2-methylcitrate dehydratase PrpD
MPRPAASSVEPASRHLADFAARTRFEDLPAAVVAEAGRAVLDWLGSAMAGSLEPPARMGQQVVAGLGASSEATVFGAGRSSAAGAALANGISSHILEFDDVHKGSTLHPAAPIIPAALAAAERRHAPGREFLLAVTLGYEIALRIGEAVNPSHYRYWHPTGTVATFGAAAAAGKVAGLDGCQMLNAFGTAGTQAAGLWEFHSDGAMSKHLHPGKAAFNGVLAADLAGAGFTGATRVLEGERGFLRAMAEGCDVARITRGLGAAWKITETCYKLHSCCGHTHTAIDCILDLRARLGWRGTEALEHASEVAIYTYGPGWEIVKATNPRTPYAAKFSLAYAAAAALAEGAVGLQQFGEKRFGDDGVCDPVIAALLPRVRVTVDDELTARYPAAWPARVKLRLRDGAVLESASEYPRGNPENPVSTAMLEEKFRGLVEGRFAPGVADAALARVRGLADVSDMAEAFRGLAGGEPGQGRPGPRR